jgi:hypothetical protein
MPVVGIVTDYQRSAAALSTLMLANWYRHFGVRVRLLSGCKIQHGLDDYWDSRVVPASDRNLYDARVQCQTIWWCSKLADVVRRYSKFKVASVAKHKLLPSALPDFDMYDCMDETFEPFLSDMVDCRPHEVWKAVSVVPDRRKVLIVLPRLSNVAASATYELMQDLLRNQKVEVTLLTEHLGSRAFRSQCRMLSQWFSDRFRILRKLPYSCYSAVSHMHDLVFVPILSQDMSSHFAEKSHAAAMLGAGTPVYYLCLYTGVTELVTVRLDCGVPEHIRARDHGVEMQPPPSAQQIMPGLQHVRTIKPVEKFQPRSQRLADLLGCLSQTFLCDLAVDGTPVVGDGAHAVALFQGAAADVADGLSPQLRSVVSVFYGSFDMRRPHIIVAGTPGAEVTTVALALREAGWMVSWPGQDLSVASADVACSRYAQNAEVRRMILQLLWETRCDWLSEQYPLYYDVPYPGPVEFLSRFTGGVVISDMLLPPFVAMWVPHVSAVVDITATVDDDLRAVTRWSQNTLSPDRVARIAEHYTECYHAGLTHFTQVCSLSNVEIAAGQSEKLSAFLSALI